MSAVVIGGSLAIVGARPDLLRQPPSQLAVLVGLWVLCLLVFPAIGVGLLFVSRGVRLALAVAAIAGTLAVTTGWPLQTPTLDPHVHDSGGMLGCFSLTLGAGLLLLAIGFVSGAFVQRRAVTSVFWVAAGLSLMALNLVTWHCPSSGLVHVLPHHLGGAIVLLVLAVAVGIAARARTPKTDCSP